MKINLRLRNGRTLTIDLTGLIAAWILVLLLGSLGIAWSFLQAIGAVAIMALLAPWFRGSD